MTTKSTILFGHRGARLLAPENSVESFQKALHAGVSGLETDVWLTSDGIGVCDHDGYVRRGVFRRRIARMVRSELPARVPSIDDVFKACGVEIAYSIDLKDHSKLMETITTIVEAHERQGGTHRCLWLCYEGNDLEVLEKCVAKSNGAHIVETTRLNSLRDGPERRAAQLADLGVSAINMHVSDWNPGLIELFHKFELKCFAFGAHTERELNEAKSYNVDAVYSDAISAMVTVFSD